MPSWLSGISGIIIAVLALLLLATAGVEELRIHNWREDYKNQTADLNTCNGDLNTANADIATLKGAVTLANTKWEALQAQQKADEKIAQANADTAIAKGKARVTIKGNGPDVMNAWMRKEFIRGK